MHSTLVVRNNKYSQGQASKRKTKKPGYSLSDSAKKYKILFDISPNAIFLIDVNAQIIETNEYACTRYGFTNEEFSQISFFEVILKSKRKSFEKYFNELLPTQPSIIETTHLTKNNKKIHVELIIHTIELKKEKNMIIIVKEIQNKKSFEKEIEEERDLLKTLMDNIPDTIYFKNKNSQFTRINKAQAELLGIENCEDAVGKTDFDFFRTKPAEAAFKDEKELFETGKSLIAKAEHIRLANGISKWVTATKVPIVDKKGNVSGLVGISRDITEIKKAEKKIQKYAKELQQLNVSKDKFFSILAHDLKNPFFSLLGFEEILANNFDELSNAEKKEYINNIFKISKNSFQLLENLLQWARTQTGRIEIRPQEIDLKKMVTENIDFFKPIAQKKKIKIKNSIKKSFFIYADPDMMKTVFRNLLTNAIKFTNHGGIIRLALFDKNSDIKIIIRDNGIGMNKETIENLFRIDVSNNSVGTSNESGTGLGLIICKEFMEKNGGEISVESEKGKGSTFILTIPKHSKKN